MTNSVTVRAVLVAVAGLSLMTIGGDVPAALAEEPSPSPALSVSWDGPTVGLAWDGTAYTVLTDSFVGDSIAVPGDEVARTLTVRNDGPDPGVLRAYLVDLTASGADSPTPFEDAVHLFWDTAEGGSSGSFALLRSAGDVLIGTVALDRGASTTVKVGYAYPGDSASGSRTEQGATTLAFRVRLVMTQAVPTSARPSSSGPAASPAHPVGSTVGTGGGLASTGLGAIALAALVLALLAGGVAALRARNRPH